MDHVDRLSPPAAPSAASLLSGGRRVMDSMTGMPATSPARCGTRGIAAALLAATLAGCASMPVTGPLAPAIEREAVTQDPPFLLIQIDRIALTALDHVPAEDLTPLAEPTPQPIDKIHVGDTISITLWEYGSGLLGPVPTITGVTTGQPGLAGAQSASIPRQVVDQSGEIIVPFAGQIHAAGRTTREVQNAIIAALHGKANETQALVQIERSVENAVTVTGDVNRPGRVALQGIGTRLLDAISEAGGASGKARDILVQLTRGNVVRSVRLSDVLADPRQNIYLRTNDLVALAHEPQTLVVLGATNKNTEVGFTKSRVTLAEALGNGGGLTDQQADPFGVYVLRYEKLSVARSLRLAPLPQYLTAAPTVPVIYQFNMKSGDGLLMADQFAMRDRDIVYVATSPSVQVGKLARLFGQIGGVFKNAGNAYNY